MALSTLLDCFTEKKVISTVKDSNIDTYSINDIELKKLQIVLLSILKDFKEACDKYGVSFMLASGTALGAVRHGGFIPWDDDIDIVMTRSNYNQFLNFAFKELESKYILAKPLDDNYIYRWPKLLLKDSKLTELMYEGVPSDYQKIFIDIFIADYVPNNKIVRTIKGITYKAVVILTSASIDYHYPSKPLIEFSKTNAYLKVYYGVRRAIGKISSLFFNLNDYLKLAALIENNPKKTNQMCYLVGHNDYYNTFDSSVFTDLIEVDFEGEKMPISKHYDIYLKSLYGEDYMELPPENKKEKHFYCALQFPND